MDKIITSKKLKAGLPIVIESTLQRIFNNLHKMQIFWLSTKKLGILKKFSQKNRLLQIKAFRPLLELVNKLTNLTLDYLIMKVPIPILKDNINDYLDKYIYK